MKGWIAIVAMLVVVCMAPPARAEGRDIAVDSSGWWQVGAVALVTGAGLAEGELLVDGFGSDEASRQAVAALSFRLDPSSTGKTITVPASSSTPPGASVNACAITAPFEPAYGGSAAAVPQHDCERQVAGTVDADGNLVIAEVSPLEGGGYVRVLLIPSQAGRIVLDGSSATLETMATADDEVIAESERPAPTRPDEQESTTSAALGPVDAVVPMPSVTANPVVRPEPVASTGAAAPAATVPRFTPRADDAAARLTTAIVLGVALCAFTALHRDSSRLRPRLVAWRRADAQTSNQD